MNIGQTEIDDFYESIRRNRFEENDFKLEDKDISEPIPNGAYPVRLEIKITRLSNRRQKVYQGGHVTAWNYDFELDLTSGFFGNP